MCTLQPKFLTKEERAAEALKRRQEQIAVQRQQQEEEKKKQIEFMKAAREAKGKRMMGEYLRVGWFYWNEN